jgi:hypothetical protein
MVPLPGDGGSRVLTEASAASAHGSSGSAVFAGNVDVLSVSTHSPSGVVADRGGPVYYQQQVLSTLSRTALGVP